jgi:hypothetical protein
MIALLLARWKPVLFAALLAFGFASGWAVNGWRWEAKQQEAVDSAVAQERSLCEENKATSREVANELRKKLQGADARYASELHRVLKHEAAKRVQPAGTPGGDDGAAREDGLLGADPETALELLALGHDGERQAEKLNACQGFIRKVWKQ